MAINGPVAIPAAAETRVLSVSPADLGSYKTEKGDTSVESYQLPQTASASYQTIKDAASYMRTSDIPVAFPTETVYGLGADATRSEAVKGIYLAKGRPSDNPLISHVCDLEMLRDILTPDKIKESSGHDPIPEIYKPLIDKFWPGPLTILLSNPPHSRLAPEVTAGLKNFGVRMPDSPLALLLIKLAGVPLAAPSANASTKPSPTTAQHVLYDLSGRIELILDGGPCNVGVESTVVDGLCNPPVVLRPGGLSIDEIRQVPGWENTVKAYKDASETGSAAPRAPGMKYKHYSPKAKVILCEQGAKITATDIICLQPDSTCTQVGNHVRPSTVGIIRTKRWAPWAGLDASTGYVIHETPSFINGRPSPVRSAAFNCADQPTCQLATFLEIDLGRDAKAIAHGLFAALRELDARNADAIFVEGIEDAGDIAAAVLNRLRKAATEIKYKIPEQ